MRVELGFAEEVKRSHPPQMKKSIEFKKRRCEIIPTARRGHQGNWPLFAYRFDGTQLNHFAAAPLHCRLLPSRYQITF